MPQLTPPEYVATGGTICPNCRGCDIEGAEVNIDGGSASQQVTCNECKATWLDVYKLIEYDYLETPRDNE